MGNATRSRWDDGSQKVQLHCVMVTIQQHFSRIISPIYTAGTARVDRLDDARTAQISILAPPARTCTSRQETSVSHSSTLVPMSIPLPHTIADIHPVYLQRLVTKCTSTPSTTRADGSRACTCVHTHTQTADSLERTQTNGTRRDMHSSS
ncbi:hypothetical protein B0H13DRAFT_2442556 [Mycena leptocephala]|nr:hypothetical protein B0H13DRAFT_2442556 [Mycena leptocephala]